MPSYRVALIEDNRNHIFLVRQLLQDQEDIGEIRVFTDAEKALTVIANATGKDHFEPDFLLLDLKLPRMDGQEFITRLRQSSTGRNLPVFVLTSSDRMEERRQCAKLGAIGYFLKPLHEEDLDRIFNRLLTLGV